MADDSSVEVEGTLRKIKKYLECPICLELLCDPYTTQCGHSFCRQCIHTFIASTKDTKCPLCKVPVTKRSMNKSACLADIIDSVRNLEEAVQKDIGVINTPPRTTAHSHECSATPGLIIHSLLHPTPFKPTTLPQASGLTEKSTSPVIQRKTRNNIRKTNNRRQKKRQKNITREVTEATTSSSSSSSSSTNVVPVTTHATGLVTGDQPSTSSNFTGQDDNMDTMKASHVDDIASDVVANPVTMASLSSSPVEECLEKSREHDVPQTVEVTNVDNMEQQGSAIDQQDMLSMKLFTSSSSTANVDALDNNNISPAVRRYDKVCDNLLEEESPTPILQQDAPLHCSTPDKMECSSLGTQRMSRSPSIPLQNTSTKMAKVDVTPVVLPERVIALPGLYSEDSVDTDHSHDSLDLFDDQVIPSSQSKGNHNLTISSPALFTADQQHQSSVLLDHVETTIDTTPTSALPDSISTQEIMRLQQELEQKQKEIASLDAAIQEKSVQNTSMTTAVCSKDDRSSLTLPSSVETINESLPTTTTQAQSLTSQSSMITLNTQMNTVALFHCADQILNGLKKTLKKDRALAPIDTNITVEHRNCTDKEKDSGLFYTPVHHVQVTRPYSDQPKHVKKMSLLSHKKLNYSAELIPSNVVSLTTSGLALNEIGKVQRLAEVCDIHYSNRLSSDTTHLVMATSNDKVCTRTPKYLQGLLRGLWIITYDWIIESLKAEVLIDEVDYEVNGDTVCASNVPRRARMAKLRKTNEILSSYTIALIGEMKEMGTRALTSLILLAGGIPSHTSLDDISKEHDDRVIMVCDPSGLEQNDLDVIRSSSVTVVQLSWLLDSISYYKMQSFDDYLVK